MLVQRHYTFTRALHTVLAYAILTTVPASTFVVILSVINTAKMGK